jgi:hypothetical protein
MDPLAKLFAKKKLGLKQAASRHVGSAHTGNRWLSGNYSDDAKELVLYIDNDGDLYRQRTVPIMESLKRKLRGGTYDPAKAPALWKYLVDVGAKKYAKEFATSDWNFTPEVRRETAGVMAEKFLRDVAGGEYGD